MSGRNFYVENEIEEPLLYDTNIGTMNAETFREKLKRTTLETNHASGALVLYDSFYNFLYVVFFLNAALLPAPALIS